MNIVRLFAVLTLFGIINPSLSIPKVCKRIEKQFVQVHARENVKESGGECLKRKSKICKSERDVQLGVISVQRIL